MSAGSSSVDRPQTAAKPKQCLPLSPPTCVTASGDFTFELQARRRHADLWARVRSASRLCPLDPMAGGADIRDNSRLGIVLVAILVTCALAAAPRLPQQPAALGTVKGHVDELGQPTGNAVVVARGLAQTSSGEVTGRATDGAGTPLPGVTVIVTPTLLPNRGRCVHSSRVSFVSPTCLTGSSTWPSRSPDL